MIYCIVANKGGVGKTSLATNLAASLSREGKKVLIIDTDGQGNVARTFKTDVKGKTIHDVLTKQIEPLEAVLEVSENLFILPANKDMNFLEFDILTKLKKYPKPFELLKNKIGTLVAQFDYVFIDTPPSLGLVAGNVLAVSDRVIIPFMPETYSVDGLIKVVESVRDFKEQLNPDLQIAGVVGMMIDKRTYLHKGLLEQARTYCEREDLTMVKQIVPRSIKYANAVAFEGLPLTLVENNEKIFKNVLKELLQDEQKTV